MEKLRQKRPEQREVFATGSGIPVKTVYAPDDIKDLEYLEDLGMPGSFPFTRVCPA